MDIHDILLFEDRFMDPSLPSGLWFCDSAPDTYAVTVNAACLGAGAGWADIGPLERWFKQYKFVLIVSADPVKRRETERELRSRLPGVPLLSAQSDAFRGFRSIEALKNACGCEAVEQLLCGARELPAYGLVNLRDVTALDIAQLPRALSGIPTLDAVTGGFLFGDVTVWSGRRGEGKSTLLHQILLHAVDQGERVCLYSGELRMERVKDWLYLQAAGPPNVVERTEQTGRAFYTVPDAVRQQLDAWLDKCFFLYDVSITAAHDEDKLMSVFEYAARRYGCSVFAVDNLMTASFKRLRDADYYRAQSSFLGRCQAFAKSQNAHFHIVAHPRKVEGRPLNGDDIGGSGDIGNRADNILTVTRLTDKQRAENGFDAGLSLIKSRWTGDRARIPLKFEPGSRRFYDAGGTPDWCFGWETRKLK
jgi:twinkle protein